MSFLQSRLNEKISPYPEVLSANQIPKDMKDLGTIFLTHSQSDSMKVPNNFEVFQKHLLSRRISPELALKAATVRSKT